MLQRNAIIDESTVTLYAIFRCLRIRTICNDSVELASVPGLDQIIRDLMPW
jgi:hypothetical protein